MCVVPPLDTRRPLATKLAAFALAAGWLLATPGRSAAQGAPSASSPTPWYERITVSGDVRLRSESFFQAGRPMRYRPRVRARLGLNTALGDALAVGMRLATGDPRDPTSTNQTLEEFFGRKPFYLDQAYLVWRPSRTKDFSVGVGKFPFPVLRTQMTWDDDLNWEGAYEQVATSGAAVWRLTAIQSPLHEVSAGPDAAMFAGQGSLAFDAGRHRVELGASLYAFRHVDQVAMALGSGDLRSQNWNLLRVQNGRVVGFASGFRLVDLIGRVSLRTRRPDYPVTLVAHWVRNGQAVDGEDTGVWLEARYGRASASRTIAASYIFTRIERDAVISAFGFSDIPSSNTLAHIVGFSYAPAAHVALDATVYLTRKIVLAPGESDRLLTRLQLDARVAF
jgi:hypothetical protein